MGLWQPVELLAPIPLPVGHALEPPAKVAQLAMLEQRSAGRLMRSADEVGRTVHFHRKLFAILQSDERVDAVPGHLATMLYLDVGTARANFADHGGLQLRRAPFSFDEGVAAGPLQRVWKPWPPRAALLAPKRPLMQL